MTLDQLISAIDNKAGPASESDIAAFEKVIGHSLPSDYREFLRRCNGGYAGGGVVISGPIGVVSVNHVGGFREESYFSLASNRDNYQNEFETRIPVDLIWIADDPGGSAFCIGISGPRRGQVFYWDNQNEFDPELWDGLFESAKNIDLLAKSFSEFVAKLGAAS